ncbi:MFS transporter [Neobacillus sp. PS3-12]|jgi:MFS family permease|uniref:MDR family MFS transporter n=1 Tax=Neobacillus sp. PS3-12 TaxID=3070677 RepID=UPI0027DF5B64|nr:MFS transporter [Neobacillus sp. PS3-12]WML54392.1 MFS transporter [Neobacillus sp. PS3-12]
MPRALWLLIVGMAVNMTGSSFLWPLNTIYIHDHLGKSLSVAGVVLMCNSAATVIGNLLGGSFYDKIGGYKTVLIGIGTTLAALICLSIWNSWPEYIIFLVGIGLGTGIIFPPMYAMAGSVWKEGGRKAFNAMYVAANLGVAIGSALGGFVADYSFQYIFIANTFMYFIFLCLAVFGYRGISVVNNIKMTEAHPAEVKQNQKNLRALLILCIGYLLGWAAYVQWSTTIAAYIQELHISLKQYGLLWTINGAMIVFGQPVVKVFIKYFAKSLKTQMLIGMVVFIGSFLAAAYAHSFKGFVVGMIILTIGEMFVWPAVPTVAFQLAPKGREGFYQGFVNSTATGGRMLGPLAGGMLVDTYGMPILFIVMIGLFIISFLTTFIYDHNLKEKKLPLKHKKSQIC